jgi:hypothetical protein
MPPFRSAKKSGHSEAAAQLPTAPYHLLLFALLTILLTLFTHIFSPPIIFCPIFPDLPRHDLSKLPQCQASVY